MTFWERIKAALPWRVTVSRFDILPSRGKARPRDYASLVGRNESWVYKCANLNAASLASIPLRLYIRGSTRRFPTRELSPKQRAEPGAAEVQEITAHPLLELLADANPTITGYELRELTAEYLELVGNAYWWLERGPLGVPKGIYPLMSQWVSIVPGDEGVAGYVYGVTQNNQIRYDAREVVHFRYPNPSDQFYGIGPLQAALKAVDRFTAMSDYQQEFFDNSARPDFTLTFPSGVPQAERERVLEHWKTLHAGKSHRHAPGYLVGDMKLDVHAFSPQDSSLIEAAKLSREEIAGIFGIPMTFLEISAARAEAEAHQYLYARFTLTPRLRRMEQVLNERLVPLFDPNGRLFLAYDDCIPESVELRLKEDETYLKTAVRTVNEVRAAHGLEPVDWGEVPINYATGLPIGVTTPVAPAPASPRMNQVEHCDVCGTIHKALPSMTQHERELTRLAEGWWRGMREDTIKRLRNQE